MGGVFLRPTPAKARRRRAVPEDTSTFPRVVKHLPKSKRHHTIETLTRDFLWIYDYDRSDIDWHAMRAGVQYVWISSWVHLPNMEHKNVSQLSFRGQEIDGVADRACYNANLEAI